MKVINNVTETVRDDLSETNRKGSRLSIAAGCFSIYAYQELRKQLDSVEQVRFIFTSPTFVQEKTPKTKREFYIPRLSRERSLYGTEFEIKLRNELTQRAIAKECADWIRKKVTFKSNTTPDLMTGFLTVDEQKRFLEIAKRSHNYYQYALILETGLRTGELIGLTWDAVDLENRTLTINKTLEYRHKDKYWRAGPPKTTHSYRTIPLTNRATEILKAVKAMRPKQKKSVLLDQPLEYLDRSSGRKKKLVMRDLVFINWRTGEPAKNSSYDTHLYKLCEEAGIEPFCMHALRHTYATRAIESGMPPKVLQKLMGHASIKTTMDTYVHVTDESLEKAVALFEANPDLLTC